MSVDWVVLSASIVGIGLASVAATSDGMRALGQDVSGSLSSATVARLELWDLPSAFSSSFDEPSSAIRVYSSGDRTAGFAFSDALGSISGEEALVINSGGTRNGGSTFGGAVFSLDQEELVEGARYRVSYWARTDGATHTMTLSNQSGSGDQSSLSHTSTLTGEWKQFTHEAVLNVSKPVVYIWTQGANQTVAIDDLKYERLP